MMETWEEESLKISYGNCFDSLAPEFETYDTIKNLAQSKMVANMNRDKILIAIGILGIFLLSVFLIGWNFQKPSEKEVKVAILYERITDGIYHPSKIRTYKDLVKILKETNPDLVFRVWWRWTPTPESLHPNNPVYQAGHTYQQLEETLRKLKKDLPEIKYWFGAIPTQRINFEEKNPITGKTYSQNETWQMALDPQKWGINFSKEKLQELAQEKSGTGKYGYFPDITNKEFQELYLSWAKRQIDAGVNGLFLDLSLIHI